MPLTVDGTTVQGVDIGGMSQADAQTAVEAAMVLHPQLQGRIGQVERIEIQTQEPGVRIIDIAADFRIKNIAVWEKWYGTKHACPELVAQAVYGLPEVNREAIRQARIVANPGCYPTAVQLGFLPLIKSGAVDLDHLIADAKSGVSGAGRKAEVHTLFAEASDNFKAYGVPGHRHHPEISQGLEVMAGRSARLVFVPHLTPMIRGIHATLYATLTGKVDLQSIFEKHYAKEPFVDVMPAGAHPDTRSVRGSNMCRIAVHQPQGGVVRRVVDQVQIGQQILDMCCFREFKSSVFDEVYSLSHQLGLCGNRRQPHHEHEFPWNRGHPGQGSEPG